MRNNKKVIQKSGTDYFLFLSFSILLLVTGITQCPAKNNASSHENHNKEGKKIYSGRVIDENNNPLPSANVGILNTVTVITTDENGYFEIEASPKNTLWFSHYEMHPLRVNLKKAKENFNVKMPAKNKKLPKNAIISPDHVMITFDSTEYRMIEKLPEYPGGLKEIEYFLSQNIKYPKKAQQEKIQGKVVIGFVIEKDGSMQRFTVLKKVSPELDEEALRVVKRLKKWKPAMDGGEPKSVRFMVPVNFRLN